MRARALARCTHALWLAAVLKLTVRRPLAASTLMVRMSENERSNRASAVCTTSPFVIILGCLPNTCISFDASFCAAGGRRGA